MQPGCAFPRIRAADAKEKVAPGAGRRTTGVGAGEASGCDHLGMVEFDVEGGREAIAEIAGHGDDVCCDIGAEQDRVALVGRRIVLGRARVVRRRPAQNGVVVGVGEEDWLCSRRSWLRARRVCAHARVCVGCYCLRVPFPSTQPKAASREASETSWPRSSSPARPRRRSRERIAIGRPCRHGRRRWRPRQPLARRTPKAAAGSAPARRESCVATPPGRAAIARRHSPEECSHAPAHAAGAGARAPAGRC